MSRGSAERSQAEAASDLVLWDVVDEHLDEAEFQIERFNALLDSATLGLDNLADVEALLDAQVDGLVVGEAPVADRLLRPLLADEEAAPARVTAAALALISAGELEPVVAALSHASPRVRSAVLRAGQLAGNARLGAACASALQRPALAHRGSLTQLASERRASSLLASLASSDEDEQVAALRAASPSDPQVVPWVEQLMGSQSERVREAAMSAGLEYGSQQAWSLCQSTALRSEQPNPFALALFAGLADPTQQAQLYQLTLSAKHKYAALGCLGYSGSILLVPWLIQQAAVEDELTAKLAGEAFRIITDAPIPLVTVDALVEPGMPSTLPATDAESEQALPPFEEDDLDADLAPSADSELPSPNAPAMQAWWEANSARFDSRYRYLAGVPLTFDAFRVALTAFPLRRRHALAALLAIRSAGATRVDTRAFTRTQRAQLGLIPSAQTPWARTYSGF